MPDRCPVHRSCPALNPPIAYPVRLELNACALRSGGCARISAATCAASSPTDDHDHDRTTDNDSTTDHDRVTAYLAGR